ncbi:40S ribosomal protein S4 [Mortierella sp. AM989]|nr:40S ribosomal protein S4 [Mortierella sp. AM989]
MKVGMLDTTESIDHNGDTIAIDLSINQHGAMSLEMLDTARGPKKHLKRLNAPKHWMLDKLTGTYAPRPTAGPHKLRECLPLIILLRNRLKYALNGKEVQSILMQRLVKVDGKVRTDTTFPAGFMDAITIEKTGENFRLVYDTKGRFTVHRITAEEAKYKLCKVKKVQLGAKGIPFVVTHDGRTIRYPDPLVKVNDTIKLDLESGKFVEFAKFEVGNVAMVTGGRNTGRVGVITHKERHVGGFDIVHIKDVLDRQFATRLSNVFVIGEVAAQDPTKLVTLSFLDESGAVIGLPQDIPHAKCTILQVSQFVTTGGSFSSATTTDLRSALNLYEDERCQILVGSSVGQWDNVAPVANVVAIRYEGTADANLPTGVVRLEGFPQGMIVQTRIPPVQWVMDPSKGKLLVGIIAGVLAVGVIIGIYQVYQASLYEIPPKKPKKDKKAKGLNTKKIKKKDAYFKKPVQNDQQTFQRLDSPAPSIAARPLMSERRNFRDSQISEAGFSVDWNQQKTMYNNGSDTVMIDMHETTNASRSGPLRQSPSALNLMNFENNDNSHSRDVRGLVGDDELLDGGILRALEEYNTEELATAIVSKHGQIENDLFLYPKSSKVFKLDHFRQIASDPVDHAVDEEIEELRKAVEKDTEEYVTDRYAEGVSAIYGSSGVITIAIVHNKYSPSNFWNGRWRSVWTLDTATSEVKGALKCKVHYYEDGNVQLETSKEVEEKLNKSSSEPPKVVAKAFLELIAASELKYQTALNESYHELAESTFNGLRRALPYTRTKLDWNKILTYRIGAELASK